MVTPTFTRRLGVCYVYVQHVLRYYVAESVTLTPDTLMAGLPTLPLLHSVLVPTKIQGRYAQIGRWLIRWNTWGPFWR